MVLGGGQAKVWGTCWSLVTQEEAAKEQEEDWIQRTRCWHGSQEKTGFTYRREIILCEVKQFGNILAVVNDKAVSA